MITDNKNALPIARRGEVMKVSNMIGSSGREIANQFVIQDGNIEYFQSYRSIIVKKDCNGIFNAVTLDKNYWNYSRTTSKYRCIFLGESTKETEKKIKSGEYQLADLNQ